MNYLINKKVSIFIEYLDGIDGIDEYQIRNYVLQIVQCLDYCQTTSIPFQDLNLNDIILDG